VKVPLTTIAEIEEGQAKEVEFFGRSILVIKSGPVYSAFANHCAHASGPLLLEDGHFRCQWHGATFNPQSGAQLDGPRGSVTGLIRLPTRIEDGQIVYVFGE
jgi:nitrite reductase/ring-hydroxylating ferredoxin subunit